MDKPYFTFSPHEDGRPIVLDGKAVSYVGGDAPPMTGEVLASSQDVREKLEEIALYLQTSLRLKGSARAERLAQDALDLLASTLTGGAPMTQPTPPDDLDSSGLIKSVAQAICDSAEDEPGTDRWKHYTPHARNAVCRFMRKPARESAPPAKTITVNIEGGLVEDVTGIPAGYELRIEDYDVQDPGDDSWDAEKECAVTVYEGGVS